MLMQRALRAQHWAAPSNATVSSPRQLAVKAQVAKSTGSSRGPEAPAAAGALCIETVAAEGSSRNGRATTTGVMPSRSAAASPVPANGALEIAALQAQQLPQTSVNAQPVAATSASLSSMDLDSPQGPLRAEDAWEAFEQQLEADLATVGVTLVAILGVICFWRGVWSLLDYYLGDNPLGDLSCILLGLMIIAYIRLAGLKVGTFWPSG